MRAPFGLTYICLKWAIYYCLFLNIFVIEICIAAPRYSSRIVETKTGAIRGVILELNSRHLEPVEVFKSVPYASAPINHLRFESPKPLSTPWKGTKLADTFGPVCPQNYPDITNRTAALMIMPKGRYQHLKKLLPMLFNQSEDCLTLNIYVPGSGNRGIDAPYSVFFFIHGESFEWGSGNPYDGSVLASYGHVIVITVNFRLGILGFIKTRASVSPGSGGNLGLMDIIAALHWTKENIAAFGGDPSRITVVGHDTGAALANLILISKLEKDLIRRVILLSGSALSPWSIIPDPEMVREEVSQQMACHLDQNGDNRLSKEVTNDITNCLRTKPLEAIMGVRLPNVRFMPSWGPFSSTDDVPDPEHTMEHTGEAFITKEIMIGMTTTESYNDFSASDIQYGLEEEQRNRLLRTYIRNAFSFHLNEIFSAVRNEYTDWDKPIQHPINIRDSTMEALSDGHTVAPLIKVGYLHARRGAKTYLFHFGYQTKDSEYPQRLGSVRGEDLPYIFGLPLVLGMPNFSQNFSRQDMGVAEAVLNFITNFCKTGDPNDAGQQQAMLHPDYGTARERTRYRGINWETYETTSQQYLSISLKPKMKSHYRGHKMAVWLNLIPQLHRPGDTEVSMRHHHFREREPHYYSGNVRTESFTRPKQLYTNGMVNIVQESRQGNFIPECTPDPTLGGEALLDTDEPLLKLDDDDENVTDDDNEEQLLEKQANQNLYSYSAAFSVTVGVGLILLLLNVLIFAGICYHRKRKSICQLRHSNNSNSLNSIQGSPVDGDISLTVRPTTIKTSNSPGKSKQEPPPSYTTLHRSPCHHKDKDGTLNNQSKCCDTYKQQSSHHHHHHHHHNHHQSSMASGSGSGGTTNTTTTGTLRSNTSSSTSSGNKLHVQPPQPPQRTSSNTISDDCTSNNNSVNDLQSICIDQQHQSTQLLHHHHQHRHMHHLNNQNFNNNNINNNNTNNNNNNTTTTNNNNNSCITNVNNNHNSNTSTLKKRVQIQEVTV